MRLRLHSTIYKEWTMYVMAHIVLAGKRADLDNQEETKRFNGPKSVVGPFDKIRRAGKARRVESLSFLKNRYENFMKFSQQPARTGD